MKNIIIVSRQNEVSTLVYDLEKKYEEVFGSTVESDDTQTVLITALNASLEQDIEKDSKEVQTIYVPSAISGNIIRGTYKYYLANGGIKADGTKVSEELMAQYKKFVELYREVNNVVVIKDLDDAKLPRATKYQVPMYLQASDYYLKVAWNSLPKQFKEVTNTFNGFGKLAPAETTEETKEVFNKASVFGYDIEDMVDGF